MSERGPLEIRFRCASFLPLRRERYDSVGGGGGVGVGSGGGLGVLGFNGGGGWGNRKLWVREWGERERGMGRRKGGEGWGLEGGTGVRC